jgi:hypothetical protein
MSFILITRIPVEESDIDIESEYDAISELIKTVDPGLIAPILAMIKEELEEETSCVGANDKFKIESERLIPTYTNFYSGTETGESMLSSPLEMSS